MRQRYSPDSLAIISFSVNDKNPNFQTALRQQGMNWPQVFNNRRVIDNCNLKGTPSVILIDPNGKICYSYLDVPYASTDKKADIHLEKLKKLLEYLMRKEQEKTHGSPQPAKSSLNNGRSRN